MVVFAHCRKKRCTYGHTKTDHSSELYILQAAQAVWRSAFVCRPDGSPWDHHVWPPLCSSLTSHATSLCRQVEAVPSCRYERLIVLQLVKPLWFERRRAKPGWQSSDVDLILIPVIISQDLHTMWGGFNTSSALSELTTRHRKSRRLVGRSRDRGH